MKIKVRATLGEYERVFEICCGTGETKTFKWLGNAVCQRFALSAPNGSLRHRDHFRGVTESAQHTCSEIRFTDGQMPHPSCIIADFLKDGDEVGVILVTTMPLGRETGHAKTSKWSNEAFFSNGARDARDEDSDLNVDEFDSAALVMIKSKANFMRLVLGSQMLNKLSISQEVQTNWGMVNEAMPRLGENSITFKEIFERHWLPFVEVFGYFAPDGQMTLANFTTFVQETGVFTAKSTSAKQASALFARIHRRVCQSTRNSVSFDLSGFVVAIILCAQLRHSDTYEFESAVETASDSVLEILDKNIVAFTNEMNFPCVTKLVFCSDAVLFGLKAYHDELFTVFEKFAQKSHTLPTSLKCDHLAECLNVVGLLDGKAEVRKEKARALHEESRSGRIFGRGRVNPMLDPPKFVDEPTPEDELIFPEFVECAARAGVLKFLKTPQGMKENGESMSIAECMLRGVQMVTTALNPPQVGPGRK